MQFSLDLSGLGQAVTNTLSGLSPLFLIVGGLVIGAAILAWGIDMLRSWQEERAVDAEDAATMAEWSERGWLDGDGMLNEKYRIDTYGKAHYDDPD